MHFSKLFLEASALLLCWALVQATPAALQTLDDSAEAQERLLFSIVPQLCTGTSGRGGVCRSSVTCTSRGQVGDGRCGWLNLGVCCVDRPSVTSTTSTPKSCILQTSDQEFTVRNPSYPNREPAALGNCTTTVTTGNYTCQLRLDLNELSLADPDNEGVCLDYLDVSPTLFRIPSICGKNSGQHLYVSVIPDSDVNIDVVAQSGDEAWDIKVTQIACDSDEMVSFDCLQKHRTPTGTITSFNYNPSATPGTRQLADHFYAVAFEELEGYCSITFTQAPGSSFSLTGDPQAVAPGVTGTPKVGSDCPGDGLFVAANESDIIDNSNFADPKPEKATNFCGLSFPGIIVRYSPWTLIFVSDSDESSAGDRNNEGFQLSYEMNPCDP